MLYYCYKTLIQERKIIEFENNIPIYLQLASIIKVDLLAGRIKPGEKLPSVRDLAMKFKINPNTVQKALGELEEMGLVITERTNGKFATDNRRLIEKIRKEYAKKLTKEYKNKMKEIGF